MSPPPSPLLQILLATTSDPHLQVVIVLCLIKVISYMNFNGCKNKYFPLDVVRVLFFFFLTSNFI